VTDTELGYLAGVTSAIQTQLNGKEATITGGATTILSSNLTASRALASNGSGKVVVSAVTDTELGHLAGVSSGIQGQLNGKQATITGGATTILSSDLTANRALASNGSGKVVVSAVTDTELGYLAGVTSSIQTQLGTKSDKLIVTNRQTSSYQLVAGDADKLIEMNVGSANNLTVPANATVAFAIGTVIGVTQYGAGKTTIVAGGGVTLRSDTGLLSLSAQYASCVLVKIGTNEWYVFGNLGA
jgi:fructose-specific component phosphotransferase system IIB-like protein